jgi:hypothetical protein
MYVIFIKCHISSLKIRHLLNVPLEFDSDEFQSLCPGRNQLKMSAIIFEPITKQRLMWVEYNFKLNEITSIINLE